MNTTTNARNRKWLTSLLSAAVAAALLGACGNRASTEDIARAAMSINQTATASPGLSQDMAATGGAGTVTDTAAAPVVEEASGATGGPATGSAAKAAIAGSKAPTPSGSAVVSAGNGRQGAGASGATQAGATANAAKSTPGATVAAAGPAAGCSTPKAPVIIGTVGNQSGIVGAAVFPGVKAVQAWAAAQNERGGIDCHPIKYVVADDGGDPSRHLTLVKQLVEQEKVIGFVYMDAVLSGQAGAEYTREKQIPVMGSEGGSTYFNGSPMHFSPGSNGVDLVDLVIGGAASITVPQGKKKVATMTCQEATWCNVAHERWPKLAAKYGYEIVNQAKVSLTQPDFTSQCLAAQNAGANVVLGAIDPNGWKRIIQSCNQVGFKPVYAAPVAQTRYDFKDDPNFEGMIIPEPNAPWFLTSLPPIAEMHATFKRHAAGLQADAATLAGWASAKLFERAARGYLSDTPTNRDILKGLWTFKDETLGGLSPKLTFPEGQAPVYPVCGWPVVIKGKAFTNDGQIRCFG